MAKAVSLKLDCGHWSTTMTRPEAVTAAESPDRLIACGRWDCEGGHYRGDRVRVGSSTRASLEIEPDDGRPPVRRADGLCFRKAAGGRMRWWCRFCYGAKPSGPFVLSQEDVWQQWDQHKTSPGHLNELRTRELVNAVTDAMEDPAAR